MLLRGIPHNVVDTHQPFHTFVVHHPVPFTQCNGDSWRPVGALRLVVDVFDLFDQPAFGEFSDGEDPVTVTFPVVIRRGGRPTTSQMLPVGNPSAFCSSTKR